MIDRFKNIHHFLKETWLGFDAISEIPEKEPLKKNEAAMNLLKTGIKKLLKLQSLAELEAEVYEMPKIDYCDDITNNKEFIKIRTLEYLDYVI